MLSKEAILSYVQQGQSQPGWTVLHPKSAYLTKQALIYGGLAIVIIILGVFFLSQSTYVITPGFGGGSLDSDSFQTWRYIDEGVLLVLLGLFTAGALKNVFDLNTMQQQVLVLMPDGFLLKRRNTEQFVAYAGVTGISSRADRYGNVTLSIRPIGSNVAYKVQMDSRYGNARALAAQIVGAQRQYVKRSAGAVQG